MSPWPKRSLRLGDYRRVLLAALECCAHPVALLTVTAPGADALGDADAIHRWNRTAARRWSKLDRTAKRRLRTRGLSVRPIARVAQRQRRGADHLHLVLLLEHELDRAAIAAYVDALRDLGPRYGFGWIDNPLFRRRNRRSGVVHDMVYASATIAARYLTRYLTEDEGQLAALLNGRDYSWRPLWVSPALTAVSGVTVRRLRRVRHAYFVKAALDMGSRPTMPVWWGDLRERTIILSLLRPRALAAT